MDKKALKKAEPERREKELVKEIETLKTQLKASDDGQGVSIIVPADRVNSIRFEEIDGSRFVLIPISDEEEPVIKGR